MKTRKRRMLQVVKMFGEILQGKYLKTLIIKLQKGVLIFLNSNSPHPSEC